MAKSRGIAKVIAYKKETTFGTPAGTSGGKQLRRTSADFTSTRESYESSEIRADQQVADFRLGIRSTDGSLSGELSPGSYTDFVQSILAKDFSAGTAQTSVGFTIAAAGSLHTLTRTVGSWLTSFEVGDVVRISVAGNAANQGNNLLVVAVSALVMTVKQLSDTALVPEAITGATVTPIGKDTSIPESGHTDDSYTVEEFYSDIAQSEVHTGVKVGNWSVTVPASGLVTTDFTLMGKGLSQTGTTQYFSSPAAQSTTGIVAAVNGAVLINGVTTSACVTDFSFSVDREMEASQCIGFNSAEAIFTGTLRVTGSLSLYFEDAVVRNLFEQEQVATLVLALATSGSKTADVISVVIPKAKLSSFAKADQSLGIVASADFTAMLNDSTTNNGLLRTTIRVADTSLV
jgi:hypothetical protein